MEASLAQLVGPLREIGFVLKQQQPSRLEKMGIAFGIGAGALTTVGTADYIMHWMGVLK
jgi:hypothetical protein